VFFISNTRLWNIEPDTRLTRILNSRPAAARLTSFAVYIGVIFSEVVVKIICSLLSLLALTSCGSINRAETEPNRVQFYSFEDCESRIKSLGISVKSCVMMRRFCEKKPSGAMRITKGAGLNEIKIKLYCDDFEI